jgi:hypothetical protein
LQRRRDVLLWGVVRLLLPTLRARGFHLSHRGACGRYRWVESVRRVPGAQGIPPGEQRLLLYHLADQQLLGVSLRQRSLLEAVPVRLASQVWSYQPGTLATVERADLPSALQAWLATALDLPAG